MRAPLATHHERRLILYYSKLFLVTSLRSVLSSCPSWFIPPPSIPSAAIPAANQLEYVTRKRSCSDVWPMLGRKFVTNKIDVPSGRRLASKKRSDRGAVSHFHHNAF